MVLSATTLLALLLASLATSAIDVAAVPAASSSASEADKSVGLVEDQSDDNQAVDDNGRESNTRGLPFMENFHLMADWHKCLYICQYCYNHETEGPQLLHCANEWCMEQYRTTGRMSPAAYKACPAMRVLP